jgi:DNA-binding transcriptional MocR family regulator
MTEKTGICNERIMARMQKVIGCGSFSRIMVCKFRNATAALRLRLAQKARQTRHSNCLIGQMHKKL